MPRWLKWVLIVAAAFAVLVAAGVGYLLVRDTATPVGVDEAVQRYQQESGGKTTTTAPRQRELPAQGVYVYATDGSETIDLLGGSTHTYPEQTTLTISHSGCGLHQRWTPLNERWEEERLCVTDAGLERHEMEAHHEFFGIADDQVYRCKAGYVMVPADTTPGTTWTTSCDSGDSRLDGSGEVVGIETRTVAGQDVETVHVRVKEQSSGADNGPSQDDYWWRTSDGLLVERASTVDTKADSPVGTATFTEQYTLALTSLTPRT